MILRSPSLAIWLRVASEPDRSLQALQWLGWSVRCTFQCRSERVIEGWGMKVEGCKGRRTRGCGHHHRSWSPIRFGRSGSVHGR